MVLLSPWAYIHSSIQRIILFDIMCHYIFIISFLLSLKFAVFFFLWNRVEKHHSATTEIKVTMCACATWLKLTSDNGCTSNENRRHLGKQACHIHILQELKVYNFWIIWSTFFSKGSPWERQDLIWRINVSSALGMTYNIRLHLSIILMTSLPHPGLMTLIHSYVCLFQDTLYMEETS